MTCGRDLQQCCLSNFLNQSLASLRFNGPLMAASVCDGGTAGWRQRAAVGPLRWAAVSVGIERVAVTQRELGGPPTPRKARHRCSPPSGGRQPAWGGSAGCRRDACRQQQHSRRLRTTSLKSRWTASRLRCPRAQTCSRRAMQRAWTSLGAIPGRGKRFWARVWAPLPLDPFSWSPSARL